MSATSRRILFGSGQALGRLFNIQRWKARADDDAFQSTAHFSKEPVADVDPIGRSLCNDGRFARGTRSRKPASAVLVFLFDGIRPPCGFARAGT